MNTVITIKANDYVFFTKKVKKVRNLLNLSQEEMAKIFDVNDRMISYWEQGQRGFKIDILEKFINLLKVNPYWLLWDEKLNSFDNIIGISSFLELNFKQYYINNKDLLFKDLRPNDNGNIKIFINENVYNETIPNYPNGIQDFKDTAETLLADIKMLKPYVNEFMNKVSELEDLLSKEIYK